MVMAMLALAAVALAQPRVLQPTLRLQVLQPLALRSAYQNVLNQHRVPTQKQTTMLTQFQALDPQLQHTLLQAMDERYARANDAVVLRPNRIADLTKLHIRLLSPQITAFWPEHGAAPNTWVVVMGSRLANGQQVVWDDVAQATNFYGPDVDFFPNSLCFKIPAGTALGSNHTVKVKYGSRYSNALTYRCVATRSYRGVDGWKFANFSAATIPWALYRNFFGAGAVEYAGGTHRPLAQEWYDDAYKGVGGGGNCYGMSNSSLRIKYSNMTTFHNAWFPAHPQDFCWLYPWQTETKESVQEDQGGQLSAEMAATINDYWNNQDHKEAWNRVNSLVVTTNRPVVCFWGNTDADADYEWGHAVVGYDTEIAGNLRRMRLYDNNEPYAENEAGGPHKSIATVNWTTSAFSANSYASASRMICLSYNECMRAPHLPTDAGGPGASTTGTVVAVVTGGQVQQIEDEAGRRFYLPGGALNTNAATRIPNSMRFIPLTRGEQPYQGPAIFIFNGAANKTLTFTVGGGGMKRLSLFQPGNVFRTDFAGQGQLRFVRILTPTRALELPNPAALQPSQIRIVQAQANERLFELGNLNLGNVGAVVTPSDLGDSLTVQAGAQAQFSLRAETFAGGQTTQARFMNISVQGGRRAILQPQNWNSLGTTSLQLNLRTLNNQPLQQIRINQ
jgi:hypothetical protein